MAAYVPKLMMGCRYTRASVATWVRASRLNCNGIRPQSLLVRPVVSVMVEG